MQSLLKERTVFTKVNSVIRRNRTADIAERYDWLMEDSKKSDRNKKLHDFALILIREGHYARPPSFHPDRPRTYAQTRRGVMSHMFCVWYEKNRDSLHNRGRLTKRIELWEKFLKVHKYDPVAAEFL